MFEEADDSREPSRADSAPGAEPTEPAPAPRSRPWLPALLLLAAFLLPIGGAFFLDIGGGSHMLQRQPLVPSWQWAGVLTAAVGAFAAIFGFVLAVRLAVLRRGWPRALSVLEAAFAIPLFLYGALAVAMIASGGFRRGRQLRSRSKLQLPPLGRGTGWLTQSSAHNVDVPRDSEHARAVADQWRENGRTEHASVAAFARLSLDLLGLGAPAKLLELAQRDGLDEIHHAEACFSLAKAIDGRDVGPVEFPAAARAGGRSRIRSLALAQLAIDSLVEGALHEGLSARVVAQLAKLCADPEIQPMLAQIAEDEGRHAAHAWDVLEWCLAEGGVPVRGALAGALKTLPQTLELSQPKAARGGAWLKYGIHGEEIDDEAYPKARASVVKRAEALLMA